jgi:2-aminobenzoate-CoA ligase
MTHYSAQVDGFARAQLPPRSDWPDLIFERPEFHYPERLNCVVELLDRRVASGGGERLAVRTPDESLSYAALLRRVDAIAQVLTHDLRLVPGNRVLLRGPNNAWLAAAWLAVVKAGLIAVATMPLLRAQELTQVLDKAAVNAALCDARFRAELETATRARNLPVLLFNCAESDALEQRCARFSEPYAAPETAAEDVALIAFTSGTTGVPKGTVHFHRDVLAICDAFPRSVLRASTSDVFCGTPPLAFTFGLGGLLLFPLRLGATSLLLEKLTPADLLDAIDQFGASVCFTAPTFYRQMTPLAGARKLSSLRRCVSAGEALPLPTRQAWETTTGLRLIDGIGATEMLHIFIAAADGDIRPGATGKVVPGYRAIVVHDDGRPAAPGHVGRLAVIGPTGCRYLADLRQRDYVRHGWNFTGDAYSVDADGYFWYQARTDDMIVSAGYNIAAPEVEAALLAHPDVAECAVIGVPDDERGRIVKAFVVLKNQRLPDGDTTEALQDFVKQQIAPYKYPRSIEFRDQLPRTETGKLQRFRLREET